MILQLKEDGEQHAALSFDAAAELDHQVATRVFVLDHQLQIDFANNAASRWIRSRARRLNGTGLSDILPPALARERETAVRDVLQGEPHLAIDGVIFGEGLRTNLSLIDADDHSARRVIVSLHPLCRIDAANESDRLPAVIARHHDLGALDRLTPRELQVLALVTQGRTTSEVAEQLHRSRRTIDCHRAAISHKLDISGLPELTVLALNAGIILCGPSFDPTTGDTLHINRPLLSRLIDIKSHRSGHDPLRNQQISA